MLSGDSTKHTWQLKTILLSESGKFGSIFGKPKVSSETNQDPCGVAEVAMNLTKPPNKNRQPSVLF